MKDLSITTPDRADLITHAGRFHADDVFATALLSIILDKDLTLSRVTALPEALSAKAIIYDIGCGELDHHQIGGNGKHASGIPYAAFGLIWRKYGYAYCLSSFSDPDRAFSSFEGFVEGIDAYDNGLYHEADKSVMSISKCIGSFNPSWDNDAADAFDKAFIDAVGFAGKIIENQLSLIRSSLKAMNEICKAAETISNSTLILERYMPVHEILSIIKDLMIMIYPSLRGGFNIQILDGSMSFPENIRGVCPDSLHALTGIESLNFVHNSGKLASTGTLDDALLLRDLLFEQK